MNQPANQSKVEPFITESMKDWIKEYIRAHRRKGEISVCIWGSKLATDFRRQFNLDPVQVVYALIRHGYLDGLEKPKKGRKRPSFKVWLAEDRGKGKGGPKELHLRQQPSFRRPANDESQGQETTTAESAVLPKPKKSEPKKEENKMFDATSDSSEPEQDQDAEKPIGHYKFEKVPHPVTNEVNVLKYILYVMRRLIADMPSDSSRYEGSYLVGDLRYTATLRECGIPEGSRPALSMIMQEMGLVKNFGRRKVGLLKDELLPSFISRKLYLHARDEYNAHCDRNRVVSNLKKQVTALQESGPHKIIAVPSSQELGADSVDVGATEYSDTSYGKSVYNPIGHYSYERSPHPVTGEVNVLEVIKFLMNEAEKHVLTLDSFREEGVYVVGAFSLPKLIRSYPHLSKSSSQLSQVMQRMGLIRNLNPGKGKKPEYAVLKTECIEWFISPELYLTAREQFLHENVMYVRVAGLKKKVESLSSEASHVSDASAPAVSSDSVSDDQVLELLAEAELLQDELEKAKSSNADLQAERDALQAEVASLKAELSKRPAAKDFLEERLAALKKRRRGQE